MGQKINTVQFYLIFCVLILGVSACTDPKSPLLMNPPREAEIFKAVALPPQQKMNAKADILFVLDNSKSMDNELKYLKTNSHILTERLTQFSQVDPHIGFLYVHDSTRYTNNEKQSNGVLKYHPVTKKQQYFEKGELVSLNESIAKKFLQRNELHLLTKYFDIEVPFIARRESRESNGKTVEFYPVGPEVEEAFSPILEATQNKNYQNSFFRAEALLVVIFITDAETGDIPQDKLKQQTELREIVENISPLELYNHLLLFKKGKATDLLAYGVLCDNEDKQCQNNQIESAPLKIRSFINLVHERRNAELNTRLTGLSEKQKRLSSLRVLNLHSEDWGEKLAMIGEAITHETLLRSIHLDFVPEVVLETNQEGGNPQISPLLKVKMGEQELDKKHWIYDAALNTVTLLPSILELETAKTEGFTVTGVAVDMTQDPKPLSF